MRRAPARDEPAVGQSAAGLGESPGTGGAPRIDRDTRLAAAEEIDALLDYEAQGDRLDDRTKEALVIASELLREDDPRVTRALAAVYEEGLRRDEARREESQRIFGHTGASIPRHAPMTTEEIVRLAIAEALRA